MSTIDVMHATPSRREKVSKSEEQRGRWTTKPTIPIAFNGVYAALSSFSRFVISIHYSLLDSIRFISIFIFVHDYSLLQRGNTYVCVQCCVISFFFFVCRTGL